MAAAEVEKEEEVCEAGAGCGVRSGGGVAEREEATSEESETGVPLRPSRRGVVVALDVMESPGP